MCDSDNSRKREEEKFKVSLETRNFEIELFWKRSLFFWGFIASAFIAFANLQKSDSPYAILIANFGMVCSFAWTLANRGSKYWIENWEQKLFSYEKYLEEGFFSKPISKLSRTKDKSFLHNNKRFSVSKLAIALSDFTFSIWLVIVVGEMLNSCMNTTIVDVLFCILSTISIVYMVFCCQGQNKINLY